jgi:hypothetical protein
VNSLFLLGRAAKATFPESAKECVSEVEGGDFLVSLVIRKVLYSVVLRFPVFGVDVSRELSESELQQFYGELQRFEVAVADQLGKLTSIKTAPSFQSNAYRENAEKILHYAVGKRLFKASEVEADLGLSKNVAYQALRRLVSEKRLTRLKLCPGGAFGYTIVKQCVPVPAVDVECDEARIVREDLKRLNAAEVQARLDSK